MRTQLLVQETGRVDTGRSGHRVELLESVRGLKKITRWPPYSLTPRPSRACRTPPWWTPLTALSPRGSPPTSPQGWPHLGEPDRDLPRPVLLRRGPPARPAGNPSRSCDCATKDRQTAGPSGSTSPATSDTPRPNCPHPSDPRPEPPNRASTTPSSSTQAPAASADSVAKAQNCETQDSPVARAIEAPGSPRRGRPPLRPRPASGGRASGGPPSSPPGLGAASAEAGITGRRAMTPTRRGHFAMADATRVGPVLVGVPSCAHATLRSLHVQQNSDCESQVMFTVLLVTRTWIRYTHVMR